MDPGGAGDFLENKKGVFPESKDAFVLKKFLLLCKNFNLNFYKRIYLLAQLIVNVNNFYK
jgi:hypothetical protein